MPTVNINPMECMDMYAEEFFQGFCKGEYAAQSLCVGDTFWGAFPDNPYRRDTAMGVGWHHGYLGALPGGVWTDDAGVITSLD